MSHNSPDIQLLIRSHINAFTKTEAKVANFVLNNLEKVIYLSVTELAEKAGVGETTVLRFCRKLDYKGFQEFKISLAKTSYHQEKQPGKINSDDDINSIINKTSENHIASIRNTNKLLNSSHIEQAIDYLIHATLIQFFGSGTSGLIAQQAAHLFMRIGKLTSVNIDSHFQVMSASLLSENDVAIGFSVSGETKDTIYNLRLAKERGAKTICITSSARSTITEISDVSLIIDAKENPLEGSSITPTLSQLSVIDILYTGVLINDEDKALKYREKTAKAVSDKQI